MRRCVGHFKALERVRYEWPADAETLTWDELANRIVGDTQRTDQQALAIVNTRKAARDLHAAVASEDSRSMRWRPQYAD